MTKPVKIHPAAEIFPMMSEEEYAGLKEDIKANKQQEPICYWRGELLDGRNRLKACHELGIKIDSWELDKDADPVAYVLSRNLHRRHLSTSQRSMVAGKLANLSHGSNQHKTVEKSDKEDLQNCRSSTQEAAEKLNVSTRSVGNAKQVIEGGSAEVKRAVEADEISVSLAAKLVEEVPSKVEQTKLIKQGTDAVKEAVTVPKKVKPGETTDSPQALQGPIQAVATQLTGMLKELKRLADHVGGEWLDLTDLETQITALKYSIRQSIYWIDCMDCSGKGCKTCHKHGWLSLDRKKHLTQEQKDKVPN